MKASDLDYTADCRACGGTGSVDGYERCPSCAGRHSHDSLPDGRINRLSSARPGQVRLAEEVSPNGYVLIHEMPVTDEDRGGLEGRFGDWSPTDLSTGPMADYQPDMKDQLGNNPLGLNGPYEVSGRTMSKSDMAGGTWPSSADLSAAQVREWAKARGDQAFADVVQALIDEPNSPW